jgi:hypothetical protein
MEGEHGKTESTSHSFPIISFQLHDHWGATNIDGKTICGIFKTTISCTYQIKETNANILGVELVVKAATIMGKRAKCYVFRGALEHSTV